MKCKSILFRKGQRQLNSILVILDLASKGVVCMTKGELQFQYLHLILIHIFSGAHLYMMWDCRFLIASDCKAAKIKSSEMH